ncbi:MULTISPECIES: GNAT family N-acetyltransferase [Bacillus cereus group]|uniref:GNAT family N-acetyltransferase n=1 Tax=Bacillus cereus TaxID=1396 RepID=A0AA44Q995_BACCE|nr:MULTISPECIES: GNAT family N-acetyltransferase [Bacillus cereus group]PFA22563.1 GNAT family N-acetyltransferase [Bacillus cereus]PFN06489.1 GNAT family N-acetyltransferase [Bacillus cereus]PFR30081.1 GNAT family N-acetyltransferase [Bacillus cereus]PFR99160.1 GNAT family N-acetyltransferase [Bacillus cereus]PGZ19026.1 GNAT family N-acetyltransferase [Bacillus cereus]
MINGRGKYPMLYTNRLILRGINISDIFDIYEYASDKEMTTYTVWNPHTTLDDTKLFVNSILNQYAQGEFAAFGMELQMEKKLIGTCGFITYDPKEHKAELAYALSRKYWGRGLATEAAQAFLEYGFTELHFNRIEAGCHTRNRQSEKVMKRLGMKYDQTIKDDLIVKGMYRDTKRYFITRDMYSEMSRGE